MEKLSRRAVFTALAASPAIAAAAALGPNVTLKVPEPAPAEVDAAFERLNRMMDGMNVTPLDFELWPSPYSQPQIALVANFKERIVSLYAHEGNLFVATEHDVYRVSPY